MIRRSLVVVAALAGPALADTPEQTAPAPEPKAPAAQPASPPITDEEEGEPKLSLPTEADRAAWQRSGFRLALGAAYGELHGLGGAPSGPLVGAKLRVGLRLDARWSALASFEYTVSTRPLGLNGLRFMGTIDPTWHVTRNLSLAAGFGFGGLVEESLDRLDAAPLPDSLETSYTFPDSSPPMARCSGVGAAGLVRAEYGIVLGPRSQLWIAAEATGQWTGCVDNTERLEPDTGEPIVRRQWWAHVGATLGLGVAWR